VKLAAVVVVLAFVLASPLAAAPSPGWQKFDITSTGSYLWRYVPQSLDTAHPAPLVVFLHGAGGAPENYKNLVSGAAEKAGCLVAMPKSASNVGWGTGADEQTVAETSRLVQEELPVDEHRIAIAGHSAGGAYAHLLAYAGSRYSAVFTLSAPFYLVSSLADPSYKPPIRMYYGTTDPNYSGSAYSDLKAQWNRLGVAWEEDIEEGWGHNSWPKSSMANGFLFLTDKSRLDAGSTCVPTATILCLNRGRFRVQVHWDANGSSGEGMVVPGASADSGLFWFFSPENWELMVKVLDGCALNQRYWVFAAATTNVHYVLMVTDTATGGVARYENPAGKPAAATTDTGAFPTCP
jgi:predicted esterase